MFEIPTLCEAELVIKAIASLKEKLGGEVNHLSKRQVSRRYGKGVSTQCDRYFTELVPPRDDKDNLYTHLFRAVYATIAVHWYCPTTVPEMEFRAAIQGHYQIIDEKNPTLRRSLAAGRNYFDYKISDGEENIDGRLGIKLGLPDVEVIDQFKHAYIPPPSRQNSKQKVLNTHEKQTITPSPPRVQKVDSNRRKRGTVDQKPVHISRQQSKISRSKSRSQHKSIMTESSSNASINLAIPSFLRSRLEAISNQLGISQSEAIQELFTWTEVGISLADELDLDELHPNAVFNSVRLLKQNASVTSSSGNSVGSSNGNDSEELAVAKQQILSLTKSLDRLTEIWHKADLANNNSHNPDIVQFKDNKNKIISSKKKIKEYSQETPQDVSQTKEKPERDQSKSDQQPKDNISPSPKRRRDSSDTVREDVNHAIDAIIEI